MTWIKNIIIIVYLMTGLGNLRAQLLHDHQYVMGYWSNDKYKDPILSFGEDSVRLRYEKLAFGSIIAGLTMSDERGRLLFYFNGCDLANADHQIMDNGTGFNPGYIAAMDCPSNNGYGALHQSMIGLPLPGSSSKYAVFHDRVNLKSYRDSIEIYSDLNYSIVDMSYNQGKGKVIQKNRPMLLDTFLSGGGLSAVKHSNGIDWWVIKQGYKYANTYYKILMTKDGPKEHGSQWIGNTWSQSPLAAGFSPDGRKYMHFNSTDGLYVMDFDRSNGVFSNPIFLDTEQEALFNGASFSPNGRYIYLGNGPSLCQVDLEESPLRLDTVAIWDGSFGNSLGQPNWFGGMQIGPDCKIYVITGICIPYMHIIMRPDEKGKACDVRQHVLKFDTPVCNIPYFPNYRLDSPYSYCNPDITVLTATQEVRQVVDDRLDGIRVSPNPGLNTIHVSLPDQLKLPITYQVSTLLGEVIETGTQVVTDFSIDMSHAPSGGYLILCRDQSGAVTYSRWMKVE